MLVRICCNRRISSLFGSVRFNATAAVEKVADKGDKLVKYEIKEIGQFYSDMAYRGREVRFIIMVDVVL